MKIAYDISQTGTNKAGCGHYALSMLSGLIKLDKDVDYTLLTNFGDFYFDSRMAINKKFKSKNIEYGPIFFRKNDAGLFWIKNDIEVLLNNPDILHSNNFWCPSQLINTKLIYTFYDCSFLVNPNWTTEINRIGCFEGTLLSSIYADWIIAISEYSKLSYLNTFPHFPEERIRVIYPNTRFQDNTLFLEGVKPQKLIDKQAINKNDFFLTVGTIEPRKNLFMLINAYSQYLKSSNNHLPLVIAGGKGWMMEELTSYINRLDLVENIILLGYVTDTELIWLYKNCFYNLYPSFYEGFGLPVLEGMQFGAPTVASNTTSIPEIVNKSAILLDPENTNEWKNILVSITCDVDKRNELSLASKICAEKFKLYESSNILFELYKEAYITPKRVFNE
jgi:glycosyltransferase involved in cell wall biosynthesis